MSLTIRSAIISVLMTLSICASSLTVHAFDFSLFKDPQDGMLDASGWLMSQSGFMPIPIIVTEPAVGVGAGLAVAYFHEKRDLKTAPLDAPLQKPSSISVGLGLATENGSWIVGGGHLGHWKDDNIRYKGFAGLASLNLDYYVLDNPLSFNIEGFFLLQEIKHRIKGTDFFLGGSYILASTEVDFNLSGTIPGVDDEALDSRNAGLGLIGYYDSRDNTFTSSKGQQIELTLTRYDEVLGGSYDYWDLKLKTQTYHQVHPKVILAAKLDAQTVGDGVPFYGLPYVNLRGVPAMRYQGDQVADIEVEARYAATSRWTVLGFAGTGWTESDTPGLVTEDDIVAGGFGFRYLMARLMNIYAGLDVAQGPEQTVVYIQVGNAW